MGWIVVIICNNMNLVVSWFENIAVWQFLCLKSQVF